MLAFGWLFNIMERGRASYDRRKILSQKSDVVNSENAVQTIASGNVSFAVDSFSYKKNELLHLNDIHFDLKKGETLGVVGRTGAGKTTLLKCLIREYDHFNGELKIGERDIRDITLHGVRSAISYVPQDHFYSQQVLVRILPSERRMLHIMKLPKPQRLLVFIMTSSNFQKDMKQ